MSRYGRTPEEVYVNPRLNMTAKVVYGVLAMCRNVRTGQCNPSHATLCQSLGICERALFNAVRALEKEGEVIRHYVPGRQTWYQLPRLETDAPPPASACPSTPASACRSEEHLDAAPPAPTCPSSYTMTEQTREQTREQKEEVARPRARAQEEEQEQLQGGVDDDPKEFLRWLARSDAELDLLPALPGFDATALVARWTKVVAPRLWRRESTLALRVFEVIHRHPRFAQPRQFAQGELEGLVDEATKPRAGKPRLATDPFDLLAKTPAGRARFQSILLFNDGPPADSANGTDSQVLLDQAIAHAKRLGRIKP